MPRNKPKYSPRPFDQDLLNGLLRGYAGAWQRIVDELHPKLLRYAIRLLQEWYGMTRGQAEAEAEDIVQDAWLAACRAIIHRPRNVLHSAYFFWCVRNAVIRFMRRRGKLPTTSLDQPLGDEGSLIDLLGGPCKFLDAVDNTDLWNGAWACLDENERYVLHRVYFEGATVREVAEELGITENQARYIKEKGLEKLKRFFEDGSGAMAAT